MTTPHESSIHRLASIVKRQSARGACFFAARGLRMHWFSCLLALSLHPLPFATI